MRNSFLCLYFILLSLMNCYSQNTYTNNNDPKKVQLVTDDIPRFWAAFDSCEISPKNSEEIYDHLYFSKHSPGLLSFKTTAIFNTKNLVKATEKYKLYYESIRHNTLQIALLKPVILIDLIKFKNLYPQATFPDIYFLIGDMNSGGKSERDGLLIGAEVNCADSLSDFTNIFPPFVKALKRLGITNIPITVIHELVHYQQSYADSVTNILGYAIKEGSADFIAKIITGKNNNEVTFEYGEQHERELWNEFIPDINTDNINKWFYNSGTDVRPSNLGYYEGYKITESYYNHSKNKKKAICEILNTKDFNAFLKKSRYIEKFK